MELEQMLMWRSNFEDSMGGAGGLFLIMTPVMIASAIVRMSMDFR
jgi:hypothetical protein